MTESHDPTTAAAVPAASPGTPDASAAGAAGEAPAPTVDQVKLALRKVKDPELNLNIIDLGLVYDIAVEDRTVVINMTLTSPGCPAGPQIMGDVERTLRAMAGVSDVLINLVWEPFWSPDKIEPRVRAYMGL
ncbi:MAG TPA: metal-sulfur cluster assembly factor [Gemmatimonadaceae bacterium]|jgi:metal-sulfur cluster biosynthetic enzyme|nr:metal-sulfur cluster assembly factor [Gemmatimonadaceae bacterium]